MIDEALGVTAAWMGGSEVHASWNEDFYQIANRLAHLYFLRERCGIETYLLRLLRERSQLQANFSNPMGRWLEFDARRVAY